MNNFANKVTNMRLTPDLTEAVLEAFIAIHEVDTQVESHTIGKKQYSDQDKGIYKNVGNVGDTDGMGGLSAVNVATTCTRDQIQDTTDALVKYEYPSFQKGVKGTNIDTLINRANALHLNKVAQQNPGLLVGKYHDLPNTGLDNGLAGVAI